MNAKVVLLDLEQHVPTVKFYREILEHYTGLYIFSRSGRFEWPLQDLTEFASWVSSGQVMVLDTLQAKQLEYEYAVIVGQLIALIEPESHVEVISAAKESQMLAEMILASGFQCRLIVIETEQAIAPSKCELPSVEAILAHPDLLLIKKYCDAWKDVSAQPHSIAKLKNSIRNILKVDAEQSRHLLGMLINLKIVKRQADRVSFRKKVLKQWQQLQLDQRISDANVVSQNTLDPSVIHPNMQHAQDVSLSTDHAAQQKLAQVDSLLTKLHIDSKHMLQEIKRSQHQHSLHHAHSELHKNFDQIDPVQMEVIHKLNQMKAEKPKDIYALRDLLEQLFPKSDVRLLLKEMIDKGYIYWNGQDVIYSHEMFLN